MAKGEGRVAKEEVTGKPEAKPQLRADPTESDQIQPVKERLMEMPNAECRVAKEEVKGKPEAKPRLRPDPT